MTANQCAKRMCILCVYSFLPFGADANGINEMKSSTQAHVRWNNNKLNVGFACMSFGVDGQQLSLWL